VTEAACAKESIKNFSAISREFSILPVQFDSCTLSVSEEALLLNTKPELIKWQTLYSIPWLNIKASNALWLSLIIAKRGMHG
jgi:hypothetical protein